MGTTNADIIRHEDTSASLPSTSRNGQLTFETDGSKRQRRVPVAGGSALHWTPDELLTALLIPYTNAGAPGVTTIKGALDYIIENMG
jgi:hypothetical protein